MLLSIYNSKEELSVFFQFIVYKHCTADSLHSPSKFMVDVVQACQKVFNETFAESRHRKNILGRMFSLREAEVGKMPEVAEGSLFDCQVETIKTVVLILLVSAFVLYMHSPNVFQCASISV